MMTQGKNIKIEMNEYLKKYPPYHSTKNLGVNVSDILKYAKNSGKKVSELSSKEISMISRTI